MEWAVFLQWPSLKVCPAYILIVPCQPIRARETEKACVKPKCEWQTLERWGQNWKRKQKKPRKKGKSYKQRKWSSHWHSVTAAARCVWVRKKIGATKPLINLWALNLSVPPSQWNPISLSQLTEGVGGRQRHVSLCISLPSGIHRPTSKVNFDFIFYAFFNLLLLLLFLKILL